MTKIAYIITTLNCSWLDNLNRNFFFFGNTAYLWTCILTLLKIVFILVAVAYFTLAERKIMASVQRRRGPNVVGFWGLLQPIADGLKLVVKELVIPSRSNARIFVLAPLFILILSFVSWSVIPFGITEIVENLNDDVILQNVQKQNGFGFKRNIDSFIQWPQFTEYSSIANVSYGVLFILAISSLNVYGIILGGWASNSKYAFLGALRSAAQMISYEVSLGLVVLPVIMLSGSLNFAEIVVAQEKFGWFVFPLLPCAIIFIISMIAETNRAPFDLPEAEAELVAGYNVEYSSFTFAMFFLGEYSNMLLMATLATIFFFGGWVSPLCFLSFIPSSIIFAIKVLFFCFLFILVRATLPRYRYDQLMDIGWKIFLPITFGYLIFVASILMVFDAALFNLEVFPPIHSENISTIVIGDIEAKAFSGEELQGLSFIGTCDIFGLQLFQKHIELVLNPQISEMSGQMGW